MSIGRTMNSSGITVRSPSKGAPPSRNMEDVELGSSSHGGTTGHRRNQRAKDSDGVELTPSVIGNGDGSSKMPMSPRGALSSEADSANLSKSLVASTMYSGCSVGMVLVNKSLASR